MTDVYKDSTDESLDNPLQRFLDAADELESFVKLHDSNTMFVVKLGPQIIPLLIYANLPEEKLAKIQRIIENASAAVKGEQNYINELVAVRLWTMIEVFIDETVVRWLLQQDRWKTVEALAKVKGNLVQFAALNRQQRVRFLIEQASRGLTAPNSPGVSGFEMLLESVGIGGSVGDLARRYLVQLAATRNLIVHRNAMVDDRFLQTCPWAKAVLGEHLSIRSDEVAAFRWASRAYIFGVGHRVEERSHDALSEHVKASIATAAARAVESLNRVHARISSSENNNPPIESEADDAQTH